MICVKHVACSRFECLCLPKSYVEILTSGVIALGGEVFGQKSGALMNGVSAFFIKETPESSLALSTL